MLILLKDHVEDGLRTNVTKEPVECEMELFCVIFFNIKIDFLQK